MAKKLKKSLTTDELARMTQRGFTDVDKKFVEVHHGMSKLATKEDLHGSARGLRNDIQESEGRLLDAIKNIDVKRSELEDLREDVKELAMRMSAFEKKR